VTLPDGWTLGLPARGQIACTAGRP
jgi:hypothetical protein